MTTTTKTTTRTGKKLWQIASRYFVKDKAGEVCWRCICGWTNSGKRSFLHCEMCNETCTMRKFVHRVSLELKKKELAKVIAEKKKKEVVKYKPIISDTLTIF